MIVSEEMIAEEKDLDGLSEIQLALRQDAVEQFIRRKTNNCFTVKGICFEGEAQGAVVSGSHPNIVVGDRVEIHDSDANDGLYDVVAVTEAGTELSEPLFDGHVKVRLVRYPADVVYGALNLIKWDEQHRDSVGLQAETLSRHTVSYDVNADKGGAGYPASMLGFLKPHVKARF